MLVKHAVTLLSWHIQSVLVVGEQSLKLGVTLWACSMLVLGTLHSSNLGGQHAGIPTRSRM